MIDKIARFIVKQRTKIGVFFVVSLVISIMLIPSVVLNYDLSEYVPDSEPAKRGLNIVEEEFGMNGVARIMINDVTLVQAKEYKDKIAAVEGVDTVLWLDDETDPYQPVEFIDQEILNDYYKDGSAMIEVLFTENEYSTLTSKAVDEIKAIIPEGSNIIGSAVDTKSTQDTVKKEVSIIMVILVPVVICILLLTTTSWFSPILFMAVIGTSIFLNMGTNVIFKHVSFITYSITAALQLAVSMDYSVFMLHQFERERKNIEDPEEAMVETIKNAMSSITSSAMTTVAGFVALVFMGFTIGADMGLVFAKGIVFSLLTVIFGMPYLILKFYPLIEKTTHKSLMPDFEGMARGSGKISKAIIALVIILVIPSYIAQNQNSFLYGSASFGGGEGTQVYEDEKQIVAKFGRSNPIIVLVPRGDYISEKELAEELEDLTVVKKVQTLANLVPEGAPDSFVPKDSYDKFRTDKYTRIVTYVRTSSESELAFDTVNKVSSIVEKYYGDNYELTGVIPITMNIKDIVTKDYRIVNLISIGAVMLILLLTFRSLILPILLILVIESGVFINMATPYFAGSSMMFLCYLIVSSIQLGATIDYGILMTNNYLDCRRTLDKKEAAIYAVKISTPALLTSGSILVCAAYLLKYISTISAISEMGSLIGRGALLSLALVIFFLPPILTIFDSLIEKTMLPEEHRIHIGKHIIAIGRRVHDAARRNEKIRKMNERIAVKMSKDIENLRRRVKEKEQKNNQKKVNKLNKKIEELENAKKAIERGEYR